MVSRGFWSNGKNVHWLLSICCLFHRCGTLWVLVTLFNWKRASWVSGHAGFESQLSYSSPLSAPLLVFAIDNNSKWNGRESPIWWPGRQYKAPHDLLNLNHPRITRLSPGDHLITAGVVTWSLPMVPATTGLKQHLSLRPSHWPTNPVVPESLEFCWVSFRCYLGSGRGQIKENYLRMMQLMIYTG